MIYFKGSGSKNTNAAKTGKWFNLFECQDKKENIATFYG